MLKVKLDLPDPPGCDSCTLDRTKFVPSYGCKDKPLIMFVGEAPGAQEVIDQRPFVGKAGRIIHAVINKLGITEEQVYWANVCSCRPPENRKPTAAEMRCCKPRLEAEIEEVNPQIIICLGEVPGRALYPGFNGIGRSRGTVTDFASGHKGLATYHPAAALYPGGEKMLPSIVTDIQKALAYLRGETPRFSDPNTKVFIADTDEKTKILAVCLSTLEPDNPISFDWETTGLSPLRDAGFCLGLSWKPGTGVAIPIEMVRKHRYVFQSLFSTEQREHQLVGFYGQFDIGFNALYGIPARVDEDPMLMHYILDERPQERSLENLTVERFNAPRYESEMLAKYKCTKGEMWKKVPPEVIYDYCARDCDWTLRLYLDLKDELDKIPSLWKPYHDLLIDAIPAFRDVENHGVWIDQEKHSALLQEYKTKLDSLEQKLREITEDLEFNPRSHPQVQEMLWDVLELEQPRLHKRRARSGDKTTREALLKQYPGQPFVETLHEYSQTYTYYSRYLRPIPGFLQQMGDGRVRANYHFDRTETGRLSTTKPAIHQIPRETTIRTMFGAPPGRVLVQADYKHLEIRMAAHIAKDANLTALVNSDVDFHTMMASQAFHVPVDKVTKEQRQAAKAVAFGLLYLMGEAELARRTGLPKDQAVAVVRAYKALMPKVWEWSDSIRVLIKKQHYVESIFGNRRRFPLITKDNFDALHREAVNMPIQGSASHLTLSSLIKLHDLFRKNYPEAHIIIMVHDSIISECPEPIAVKIAALMREVMTKPPFETKVTFPVDIKIGPRWGEGEEV